jgi:hypothetical protein
LAAFCFWRVSCGSQPRRAFPASRKDAWKPIDECHRLDWLILTKRPQISSTMKWREHHFDDPVTVDDLHQQVLNLINP